MDEMQCKNEEELRTLCSENTTMR